MPTIFLSHSSRNDALATSLEAWLKRNGFADLFVDHTSIRLGDKWTEALRRAKATCRVVVCLVTPEWLASDECYGEFTAAWYAGRRIIPLLAIEGAMLDEKQKNRLQRVGGEYQGVDISAAGAPTTLDLDAHPEIAEPFKAGLRAAGALAKIGLDPHAFEVDKEIRPEPFPGLESFGDTDADAAIFFGRSAEIAQSLEDLRGMRAMGDRRAYAMQGASGSGKSSLMKAGVLPRLRRERGWLVLRSFRPGADPMLSFACAISQTAQDYGGHIVPGEICDALYTAWRAASVRDRATIDGVLRDALDAQTETLRERADRQKATMLIAMDQGEELARADSESAKVLGDFLRAAIADTSPGGEPVSMMLAFTVRTDSFQELQTSPRFRGIPTRPADIRSIPTSRFASAIEQPAMRYGVELEPQLVDALVEDATGQDALPLLAFTLQRLWQKFSVGRVGLTGYAAVGRLSGLLEDAAERALCAIDPFAPQRPLVPLGAGHPLDRLGAHVFVPALAQIDIRGAAIRRVARLDGFNDAQRALIGHFADWRLVVISADEVEVAHEALFREWSRFRQWLTPERARLETLRGLESAAAAWNARGRNADDLLHRGRRLREAVALRGVEEYRRQLAGNADVGAYIDACRRAQGRQRLSLAAFGLVVLAAVLYVPATKAVAEIRFQRAELAAEQRVPTAPILARGQGADRLADLSTFRDCRTCPEMVVLGAGSFVMGMPGPSHGPLVGPVPAHRVHIPRFAIGKYPVTFGEWDACVAARSCPKVGDEGYGEGNRPVINVNADQAQRYAAWLSRLTGERYRLLSESEWEYAARAGTTTTFYTGNTITQYQANFKNSGVNATTPVGSYPPNPFGLYDIVGNVWSWVADCWHDNYEGAPTDGSAWLNGAPMMSVNGTLRCTNGVIRGGAWGSDPTDLQSYSRTMYYPESQVRYIGFRVARTL